MIFKQYKKLLISQMRGRVSGITLKVCIWGITYYIKKANPTKTQGQRIVIRHSLIHTWTLESEW